LGEGGYLNGGVTGQLGCVLVGRCARAWVPGVRIRALCIDTSVLNYPVEVLRRESLLSIAREVKDVEGDILFLVPR